MAERWFVGKIRRARDGYCSVAHRTVSSRRALSSSSPSQRRRCRSLARRREWGVERGWFEEGEVRRGSGWWQLASCSPPAAEKGFYNKKNCFKTMFKSVLQNRDNDDENDNDRMSSLIVVLLRPPQLSKPRSLSSLSKCYSVSAVLFPTHLCLEIEISLYLFCLLRKSRWKLESFV